jgi:hypothetical protein
MAWGMNAAENLTGQPNAVLNSTAQRLTLGAEQRPLSLMSACSGTLEPLRKIRHEAQ